MRVYVAGSRRELDRVRGVIAKLRAAGCTVPDDWTELAAQFDGVEDRDIPDERAREIAKTCLAGVLFADVALLLAPVTISRFSWGEFVGAIVARDHARHTPIARVFVSGHANRATVATRLADALFETDDDAVKFIARAVARAS